MLALRFCWLCVYVRWPFMMSLLAYSDQYSWCLCLRIQTNIHDGDAHVDAINLVSLQFNYFQHCLKKIMKHCCTSRVLSWLLFVAVTLDRIWYHWVYCLCCWSDVTGCIAFAVGLMSLGVLPLLLVWCHWVYCLCCWSDEPSDNEVVLLAHRVLGCVMRRGSANV